MEHGLRGCRVPPQREVLRGKCVTCAHEYSLPTYHHKLIEGNFPLWKRLGPLFRDMV